MQVVQPSQGTNSKEYFSSVSLKGQVTIPVEIRKRLKVSPKDKIAFQVEGNRILLAPASMTLEAVYGSVKPTKRPEDYTRLTREAKEVHVERILRKMRSV